MPEARRGRHRRGARTGLTDISDSAPQRFAVFVSPHGYGHAARASAVMAELHARCGAEFEVFTTAPRWFFEESLAGLFRYHAVECDVGFRQASALHADLDGTVAALGDLVPFDQVLVDDLAAGIVASGCQGVLCDIAPMGVAVAERASLPSVIVENFDWSWLYGHYAQDVPGLRDPAQELARWRSRADLIVQTEPLCARVEGSPLVEPISREPRTPSAATRARLDVGHDERLITVTMGGYRESMAFLERLRGMPEVTFLVTGAHETKSDGNLRLVSNQTPVFMPDLLHASDAVVAKLGYGIISEIWKEGLPFAYVGRPGFPEMPALEAFVRAELHAFEIPSADFAGGEWVGRLPELLAMPRAPRSGGGASAVAEMILAG